MNTLKLYGELQEVLDEPAAKKLALVIGTVQEEVTDAVTKTEFRELTQVVGELAEAQKRTEIRVEELAEAQKKTEMRLDNLTVRVEELAEAQKKTEMRLDNLTVRVEELAEAQKRTEITLQKLIVAHQETRKELKDVQKQLGGLSNSFGYFLENKFYGKLPAVLLKDFGIETKTRLIRKFIKDADNEYIEVNIVGEAVREGREILIAGESKSQLSKKDVDAFIRKKLNRLKGVYPELFPILVTHMISQPDVENYARNKGIALYYSYDFE